VIDPYLFECSVECARFEVFAEVLLRNGSAISQNKEIFSR